MVRLSFDIDEATHAVLAKHIPRGMGKYVYKNVMECLAEAIEEDPASALSRIFAMKVGIKDLIKEPS